MPLNYSRQESESQPEWGYGERAPYPYDSSPQPGGSRDDWGWRDAYPPPPQQQQQQQQQQQPQQGHERHPGPPHQHYPPNNGAPPPPWGSPSYGGPPQQQQQQQQQAQQQAQQAGYQRRHSAAGQSHPQQYQYQHHHEQHEQHAQHGQHPPHMQQRPSTSQHAYPPHQMSGSWAAHQDQAPRESAGSEGGGSASRDHASSVHHRQDSVGGSAGEDNSNWEAYNDCWSGCYRKLAPHLEIYTMLSKNEADSGQGRASYKMQNNFLMKILFDEHGETPYHVDCVLRIFKISKGRLKRLQERIKRELRGELTRHGLYGRPSNNRKKPETIRQFTDFVKANRISAASDDSAKVRFILPPQITSIQGDCPGSLKTQFDKHQIEMSTEDDPRELVSSGTAQTWFKKYFEDTLLPSGPHPPGSSSTDTAAEDDKASSMSSMHAAAATSSSASTSASEKRPGPALQSSSRKRLHVDKPEREADENDSTDGTASTGNASSDMQSRTDSHNGSRTAGSTASDSGLGSVADSNGSGPKRPHKAHRTPHHQHTSKKKPGSDSDGSVIVESPELD